MITCEAEEAKKELVWLFIPLTKEEGAQLIIVLLGLFLCDFHLLLLEVDVDLLVHSLDYHVEVLLGASGTGDVHLFHGLLSQH